MSFYKLNATTASLSDVREILAGTDNVFGAGGILLYIDEIQYFNRKQQQSLLEYIEDGRVTLIASTTENPHFYIYNAIISRSSSTAPSSTKRSRPGSTASFRIIRFRSAPRNVGRSTRPTAKSSRS